MYTPTGDDLQILACYERESGFRCVYPKKLRWQAKPYRKQALPGTFANPREAARAVIRYWYDIYGEDWRKFFELRQSKPWLISMRKLKTPTFAARYLGRGYWAREQITSGGFNSVVWLMGERTPIFPVVRKCTCFTDQASAQAGIRLWVRMNVGLFGPLVLRRAQGRFAKPDWWGSPQRG